MSKKNKKEKALKKAKALNLLFRMVDLKVPEDVCWTIAEALKRYGKKKGRFSIKDSVKITCKQKEIFNKSTQDESK